MNVLKYKVSYQYILCIQLGHLLFKHIISSNHLQTIISYSQAQLQ